MFKYTLWVYYFWGGHKIGPGIISEGMDAQYAVQSGGSRRQLQRHCDAADRGARGLDPHPGLTGTADTLQVVGGGQPPPPPPSRRGVGKNTNVFFSYFLILTKKAVFCTERIYTQLAFFVLTCIFCVVFSFLSVHVASPPGGQGEGGWLGLVFYPAFPHSPGHAPAKIAEEYPQFPIAKDFAEFQALIEQAVQDVQAAV